MLETLAGFSKNPRESLGLANKMQQKAIELDGSFAIAHAVLGFNLLMLRQYDEAVAEAERAFQMASNSIGVLFWYGTVLWNVGRADEAVQILTEALRLNPHPPNSWLRSMASALRESGRYDEAVAYGKRAVQREPGDIISQLGLTATYIMAGQEEEARAAAREVLRINPKFSIERLIRTLPMKDPSSRERLDQAFKKAGLPD
jgi:tetratricopeptide (TPR) repeat protein